MSTITVIGDTSSAEGRAALLLKTILERNNGTKQALHRAAIVVEHTLNRGLHRELDLILIYEYLTTGRNLVTRVAVIEVKDHGPDGIQVAGETTLRVRYGDKWKAVQGQAAGGATALAAALRDLLKRNYVFVESALLFPNAIRAHIPLRLPHSVLFADSDREDLIERLAASHRDTTPDLPHEYFGRLVEYFRRIKHASPIDRQKLERITKQLLSEQKYEERLGEQMLMFRGRGGTGKTVTLLRLGYELRVRGNRVGVVTYNKTLVTDIKRQLHLLALDREESEGALHVFTADALMWSLGRYFGFQIDRTVPYDDSYRTLKKSIGEVLELANAEDLENVRRSSSDVAYDFLLIDECQDWPEDERDIVLKVFGPNRLVLADGRDQFVRKMQATSWREKLGKSPSQVVVLRKSLRLKLGLCRFSHAMADQLGVTDWDLEEQPDIGTGEVHIVVAPQLGSDIVDRIGDRLKATGNEWIDVLCCVPPQQVNKTPDGSHARVASLFERHNIRTWDAVNKDIRSKLVASPDHVRIVQYDSCRGLEGWIVLAVAFDQFFDHKRDILSGEADVRRAVAQWLMMPLTRAIDTLIIHIANPQHELVGRLRHAMTSCDGLVFWHRSAESIPAVPSAATATSTPAKPASITALRIHDREASQPSGAQGGERGRSGHNASSSRTPLVKPPKVAEEVRRPRLTNASDQLRPDPPPPVQAGDYVRLSNGLLAMIRAIHLTRVGGDVDWTVTVEVLEGREMGRVHRTYWKLGRLQPDGADHVRRSTTKIPSESPSNGQIAPVKVGDHARLANGSLCKVLDVEVTRGDYGTDWVVTLEVLEGPQQGRMLRMHWKVGRLKVESNLGRT